MKTRVLLAVILSLALNLVAGCGGEIEPGRTTSDPPVVSGLEIATAEASLLAGAEIFVGTVESSARGMITSRIDGRVKRIAVSEGERIKAGTLLVTIEDNVAGDRLAEAEGARQAAEARTALAQKTFERYQSLFSQQAVTPQEMDRVSAELEMSRQQLRSAEAAVSAARTAASYSRVVAPYAGQVVRKEVREGSTVMPGTPLLVLDRAGKLQVRAEIGETWAGKIETGQKLSVELPAIEKRLTATVADVLPASDPRSRSFQITLDLPEDADIKAGLYARVFVGQPEVPTVLVPQRAVVERGQLHGVFIVDEQNMLRYRLVRPGRLHDDKIELLSGLEPGMRYVSQGVERAINGAVLGE